MNASSCFKILQRKTLCEEHINKNARKLKLGDSCTGVHFIILLLCYVSENFDKVYQTKSL